MAKQPIDRAVLEAALHGYQNQMALICERMAEIEKRLKKAGHGSRIEFTMMAPAAPAKDRISRAGKARIAAAQRKRWAAYKKQKTASGASAAGAASAG